MAICLTTRWVRYLTLPIMLWAMHVSAQQNELSVQIQQITSGPKHHFFGYIGHSLTIPWNTSGRYIVALQTDFYRRMPEPGEKADIVLIDTEADNEVERLDETHAWNLQQGTMLYWNPDAPETQFFFNDLDPGTGVVFTVLYDIRQRRRLREYRYGDESIANGGVAPGGKYFAGINYGKITRSRKVISYAGATDWTANGPANPDNDGLFLIDSQTGDRKLLLSYQELANFLRVRDKETYPIYVHHTIWNRDSDRIFFIVRGNDHFRPNAGCIIHADGTGLSQIKFDGHPEWAEGKLMSLPGCEVFTLFDVDRKETVGKIGRLGVFPDTWEDNALSPDAKWYVGGHNPTNKECVYTFYNTADDNFVRSPAIRTMRDGGDVRIDPAPRWNRSSDAILAPGIAADDSRQLFVVRIVR